jgi:hypothetical protein
MKHWAIYNEAVFRRLTTVAGTEAAARAYDKPNRPPHLSGRELLLCLPECCSLTPVRPEIQGLEKTDDNEPRLPVRFDRKRAIGGRL